VRSDKVHQAGREPGPEERTGPRHAAPRRPLFTRFQMPAGKAVALAAMPTAVLMGMGLTPTLAQAKTMPKNPFQDGPCVTQQDESPADTPTADKPDTTKDKARDDKARDDKKSDKATPSPSASPKPSSSPRPKSAPSSAAESKAPSPAASGDSGSGDSGSGGLLGALGGALGDVLSPGQKASATPSPSPSAGTKDSGSAVDKATGTVGDTVDKVTGTAKDVTQGVGDAVHHVAGKAKDITKPLTSPNASANQDQNGKTPFPCVVEKKSKGTAETPPVTIPNEPWVLQASSLLLKGLDYKGVVNLTTADGQTKQVLKFTADDGIDIGDLHQIVIGPQGRTYHVQAAPGSTSTIRGGRVTMYTESLSGNLFGLIPITFDPEHPPPVNIPVAYFTHVKITQAGQFGGNLTVPGLHLYVGD
jgi:hypothetical protein